MSGPWECSREQQRVGAGRKGDVEAGAYDSHHSNGLSYSSSDDGHGGPPAKPATVVLALLLWAVELWRRVKLEVVVEWPMLRSRWKLLLVCLLMQYVHGMFTSLAYRLHHPSPAPLYDLGFALTPELGAAHHWVSESLFAAMLLGLIAWTFSPFVCQRKRFYTVVLLNRLLQVLVACQALRIASFTATQLPGPAFHCRAGQATSTYPWYSHWWEFFVVNVGVQSSKSCGDLIFSSHTSFVLAFTLAFQTYGSSQIMKRLAWAGAVVLSVLIIASRKHYSVDVVVAWYTVPLVFFYMQRRWTTQRPILPLFAETPAEAADRNDPASPRKNGGGSSGNGEGSSRHHGISAYGELISDGAKRSSNGSSSDDSAMMLSPSAADGGAMGAPGAASATGFAESAPLLSGRAASFSFVGAR